MIAAAAHDERVDVYAAGVVLRCVHAGDDRPWPGSYGNFDIFAAVQRGERPSLDGVGSAATKLVERAWHGAAAAVCARASREAARALTTALAQIRSCLASALHALASCVKPGKKEQ